MEYQKKKEIHGLWEERRRQNIDKSTINSNNSATKGRFFHVQSERKAISFWNLCEFVDTLVKLEFIFDGILMHTNKWWNGPFTTSFYFYDTAISIGFIMSFKLDCCHWLWRFTFIKHTYR